MIAPTNKHRFYTKKEATWWLENEGFKPVKGLKGWYINQTHSAELQEMPASGRWVVMIGLSDKN